MYTITDKFAAEIARSHKVVTRCDVYYHDALQQTLDITDGNVTVDDVAIQRQFDLTLTDPDGVLTPGDASDLFAPAGTEIKAYRGVDFLDGTDPELIPMGVCGITRYTVDDSGQGLHIRIDADDRGKTISERLFLDTFVIQAGTEISAAINSILYNQAPEIPTSFSETPYELPLTIFEVGDDPWAGAMRIAEAYGMLLYPDPDGVIVLTPQVDPVLENVDMEYVEGDGSRALYINKILDREDTHNGCIVISESSHSGYPLRGEAWDDDPTSPTYRFGPLGSRPDIWHTNLVTTQEGIDTFAYNRFNKIRGLNENVQVQALVNPAHEIGDIVYVRRERISIDNFYIVSKLTVPLTADRPMYISSRRRKVA